MHCNANFSSTKVPSLCAIVPALDAEQTIGTVVSELMNYVQSVFVIDDGSTDRTAQVAHDAGAWVVSHGKNRGKGAALRTGLETALLHGFSYALTLDADCQHVPSESVLFQNAIVSAHQGVASQAMRRPFLFLGVRDLKTANAPRANQLSNGFSNWFLSMATGQELRDTQCGMRCYDVSATLDLGSQEQGFGFEAEVILLSIKQQFSLVQIPIQVRYPPNRTTHFDSRKDPWRIVGRVLRTLAR